MGIKSKIAKATAVVGSVYVGIRHPDLILKAIRGAKSNPKMAALGEKWAKFAFNPNILKKDALAASRTVDDRAYAAITNSYTQAQRQQAANVYRNMGKMQARWIHFLTKNGQDDTVKVIENWAAKRNLTSKDLIRTARRIEASPASAAGDITEPVKGIVRNGDKIMAAGT